LGYTEQPGSQDLREAIAATYTTINPEQVNVCAPAEGIYLAMRALLQPGDHVVATAPEYQSLTEVARAVGCDLTRWLPKGFAAPPGSSNSSSSKLSHNPSNSSVKPWFDPTELAQHVRPGITKAVIANFPHNPTGAVPSPSEMERIIDVCRAAGCHLFVDEMYRGLEHSPLGNDIGDCDGGRNASTSSGVYDGMNMNGIADGCGENGSGGGRGVNGVNGDNGPVHVVEMLAAACDGYERGISLSGLSKTSGKVAGL
jgi:aspartate/methionine/tyrosine aminotransferase